MSERETTPPVFTENFPLCQAVLTVAATAAEGGPPMAMTGPVAASKQAAVAARTRCRGHRAGMIPSRPGRR
jgi:hypothetical protein